MSVLDEIKQLEAQKQKLLTKAKSEALKAAQTAISDLKALGFEYHLAEGPKVKAMRAAKASTTTKRRSGMREKVRKVIAASEAGLVRKEVFAALNARDKSTQQSISNALSALKKANVITTEGRNYVVV